MENLTMNYNCRINRFAAKPVKANEFRIKVYATIVWDYAALESWFCANCIKHVWVDSQTVNIRTTLTAAQVADKLFCYRVAIA